MMTNKNEAIGCTVNNCTHHAQGENYCTLNKIQIGTHESNPTKIECTDCESFVKKPVDPRAKSLHPQSGYRLFPYKKIFRNTLLL